MTIRYSRVKFCPLHNKFNLDQPANPSPVRQTENGGSNPVVVAGGGCNCHGSDDHEEKVYVSFLCFSWRRSGERQICAIHQN